MKDFSSLNHLSFSLLYSTSSNLNNIFINNFKLNYNNFFNNHCDDPLCTICKFIYKDNFIKSNHFFIPVINNSTCKSTNLIYILICVKCNVFYIGQTKRKFRTRFYEYVDKICKFDIYNSYSEVSLHFNSVFHNFNTDLKYLIFKTNVVDLEKRLSIELDLIHLFLNLKLNLLNQKIANQNI
jgi:hypothetical protein